MMNALVLDVETAQTARDALAAQLDVFATKAASDPRYKPMAARTAHALGALERALEENGEHRDEQ